MEPLGREPADWERVLQAEVSLLRSPADRASGRDLLRLLSRNADAARDWPELIASVPPHCEALVGQLARQYAQMWAEFADRLASRSGHP